MFRRRAVTLLATKCLPVTTKPGMKKSSFLFLLMFLISLAASAQAQTFPWEAFKPRTVKEVVLSTTKAVRPDDSMFLATSILETKALVTFTGESRPISKARKNFLNWWAGMLNHPKEYADLYDTEYLYKEGEEEYWLATQKPITKYFAKELKPNDKMILFLISTGAYRDKGKIDGVLLVEEYQMPKQ